MPIRTILFLVLLFSSEAKSQSVLSSGTWYKLGTKNEGIHYLTYNDLVQMGMNLSQIDPRNLSMYGNYAGMIPLLNSAPHIDDLQEMAIDVTGEGDGNFDISDTVYFYSQSQHSRKHDLIFQRMKLERNMYSDSCFFFLTVKSTPGKRIQMKSSLSNHTDSISNYSVCHWHESDSMNLLHSGKLWFGDILCQQNNLSRNFTFDISHLANNTPVFLSFEVIVRTFTGNTMWVSSNGHSVSRNMGQVGSSPQDSYGVFYKDSFMIGFPLSSGSIDFYLNPTMNLDTAYINYFSVNYRNRLDFFESQQIITDLSSVGPGRVAKFSIANPNAIRRIWDVTDPMNVLNQQFVLNSSYAEFNALNDVVKTYLAFDGQQMHHPVSYGNIANQNLHGIGQTDYLVIAADDFVNEANTLASFRQTNDGFSTTVATTSQIYNEYSSGSQDPMAIRHFIRQVYAASASSNDSLKHVLLFGNGSYDYKGHLGIRSSLIPAYQKGSSINQTLTLFSEFFYCMMNDTATESHMNWQAFSIGRIPARNNFEASIVNRIIDYSSEFGSWRKKIVYAADGGVHSTFSRQSDTLSNRLENAGCDYDVDKVYEDAYPGYFNGVGYSYPLAKSALKAWLDTGCLIMQWMGHGSTTFWANDTILDSVMICTPSSRPALLVGATIFMNRFDDPANVSLGQLASTNSTGSAIATIGSSRLAFSSSNFNLMQKLQPELYRIENGKHLSIGEAFRRARLNYYNDPYIENINLLGDPALRLNFPMNHISINSVNGNPVSAIPDTVQPGQLFSLTGEVQDLNGTMLTNFNGNAEILLFDQKTHHQTLGTDTITTSTIQSFYVWDDTLNFLRVPVVNGAFSASFNLPWSIDSGIGPVKLSLYATDSVTDASGCFDNLIIKNLHAGIENPAVIHLNVYPNPAGDKIYFDVPEVLNGCTLFLLDAIGQQVRTEKLTAGRFILRKELLASGVYFFRVFEDKFGSVSTGKLIFN